MLELLSEHPDGLRMTDIAAHLGIAKSSATVLLSAAMDLRWLSRNEETSVYSLGLQAFRVGQQYTHGRAIIEKAQPAMDSVRDELNETVRLAVLDGIENVYLANSKGGQVLALDTPAGTRIPAYATGLGKVLLSALDDDEVRRRYEEEPFAAFTEHTLGDIEDLVAELAKVRNRGWGEDREEYVLGVKCVAVPIRDHTGSIAAALSVSVPTIRFRRERRRAALEALTLAAERISLDLGAPSNATTDKGTENR